MTPDEQALLRALVLEVKLIRRDLLDLQERVKIQDNLGSLQGKAIQHLNDRILLIDVNQTVDEWDSGIPPNKINWGGDMREALAHALSGPISLAEDDWRERPVDRLHALASAQIQSANRAARDSYLAALGKSLVGLRDANRADEYDATIARLVRFLCDMKPSAGPEFRVKIARQAIHENIVSFCPRCKGTKEVPAYTDVEGAQRMMPCPEDTGCGGSGKRRYSDGERAEALGIERGQIDRANAQLAYAHRVLAQAESEAVRMAIRLLERW